MLVTKYTLIFLPQYHSSPYMSPYFSPTILLQWLILATVHYIDRSNMLPLLDTILTVVISNGFSI